MSASLRLRGDVAGVECVYALRPGRSGIGCLRGNAIALPVRGVSRRHAELSVEAGVVTVSDLGSRNGVRVNGVLVQAARLRPGDELQVGPVRLRLEGGEAYDPAVPAAEAGAAPDPLPFAIAAAGCLVAQLVLGKATRDALFLTHFDVARLPPLMAGGSALALLVVLMLSRAQALHSPGHVASRLCGIGAACLMGVWLVSLRLPGAAAILLYAYAAAMGAALVSAFWAVVNERFDPHAAKRLYGRIASGASLGGLLGGLIAWLSSHRLPITAMLPVMAGLTAAAGLTIRHLAAHPAEAAPGKPAAPAASLLTGLRVVSEAGYLRVLAAVVALAATVEALVDYALKAHAAAALARPELLAFFSVFHASAGLAAFAGQAIATRWALERAGLAGTMALAPGGVACAAAAALGAPGLATAVLARGGQFVLQSSFFRPGYELCFTALPAARRRPAKTVVDVGADKLGAIAGAGLVLTLSSLGLQSPLRAMFVTALVGAGLSLALTRRLHDGYVGALTESLRSGDVPPDSVEAGDATTRLTLSGFLPAATLRLPATGPDPLVLATAALRSGDPDAVRPALRAENLDPRLAPHLVPLLARADVGSDARRALRRLTPGVTGLLVDCLLDAGLPVAVRARIPSLLGACATARARDGLVQGLDDADLAVRRHCARALQRLVARAPAFAIPKATALALVSRELGTPWPEPAAAASSAAGSERRLAHVFDLLALAFDSAAVRGAYRALGARDARRGTALEYLETVLPAPIRDALWPRLAEPLAAPARRD
jgi:hypothetical protein